MNRVTELFHKRRIAFIGVSVLLLLCIPLIAMQLTDQVDWSLFDFVIMGALLFGVGLVANLILTKVKKRDYRDALLFVLAILFLLIWAELAVGIFGTPLAGS